jgi:photosystem II P680 reaction center D2 protein
MTIAIGQEQDRGAFDLIDDWLKKDRFVFIVGLDYYYFHVHI